MWGASGLSPTIFKRVVGLDRAGQVELAAMIERPAAMSLALHRADIVRQLGLEFRLLLTQVPVHEYVFGGNGGIRLKLEDEMAVRLLQCRQCVS